MLTFQDIQLVSSFILVCILVTSSTSYTNHVTTSLNGSFNFILNPDDRIYSTSQQTWLQFQAGDGNLVLYHNESTRTPLWASGTDYAGADYVEVRRSGNLIVKTNAGDILWQSFSNFHIMTSPHQLIVDNRCVYLMDKTNAILWYAGGGCAAPFPTFSPRPTAFPTVAPSHPAPSWNPSRPSVTPTRNPSGTSGTRSVSPSFIPTMTPSMIPSAPPTATASGIPSFAQTIIPSILPSVTPTRSPSVIPTPRIVDVIYTSTGIDDTDDKSNSTENHKDQSTEALIYIVAGSVFVVCVLICGVQCAWLMKKTKRGDDVKDESAFTTHIGDTYIPSEKDSSAQLVQQGAINNTHIALQEKNKKPNLIQEDAINTAVIVKQSSISEVDSEDARDLCEGITVTVEAVPGVPIEDIYFPDIDIKKDLPRSHSNIQLLVEDGPNGDILDIDIKKDLPGSDQNLLVNKESDDISDIDIKHDLPASQPKNMHEIDENEVTSFTIQ